MAQLPPDHPIRRLEADHRYLREVAPRYARRLFPAARGMKQCDGCRRWISWDTQMCEDCYQDHAEQWAYEGSGRKIEYQYVQAITAEEWARYHGMVRQRRLLKAEERTHRKNNYGWTAGWRPGWKTRAAEVYAAALQRRIAELEEKIQRVRKDYELEDEPEDDDGECEQCE